MRQRFGHEERHTSHRGAWLRASVLGANDGIVSTACLVLGVAAASDAVGPVITAGAAGLVAGALSMAVGELVSVGSQADIERADVARETKEHAATPEAELDELTEIYAKKGLPPTLAREVAIALTAKDALGVHLAEELGITDASRARPLQAAASSATSFALGAALPLVAVAFAPLAYRSIVTACISVVALGTLGAISASLGGAPIAKACVRVVVGGIVAMALTMGIGHLVGTSLG